MCIRDRPSAFRLLYDEKAPIKEKIKTIVTEIYGGEDVAYAPKAEKAIRDSEALGKADLPICVAKTQYSLSDDPAKPVSYTHLIKPSGDAVFCDAPISLTRDRFSNLYVILSDAIPPAI